MRAESKSTLRILTVLSLMTSAVPALCASSTNDGPKAASPDQAMVTRVFQLDRMGAADAASLVRSQLHVRRVASLPALAAIVVGDEEDQLTKAQHLLSDKGVLSRSLPPHGPLKMEARSTDPAITRVFALEGIDAKSVMTIVRAIYEVGEVRAQDDGAVSVSAPADKVKACEALLRAMNLLTAEKRN